MIKLYAQNSSKPISQKKESGFKMFTGKTSKKLAMLLSVFLLTITMAWAHAVQVGYVVLPNGFIRVYIEHWHGDQTIASLVNNGMSITTTYGSVTVTQNVNPTGAFNNTAWNNLPGAGSSINILSQGPSANRYNDWAYYDFAPAACNVPVNITLNGGLTVVLQEESNNIWPQTISGTFNDTSAPTITPANTTASVSCGSTGTNVNFSATAIDNCTQNPTVTYSIAPGSFFPVGTTNVTAYSSDDNGNSGQLIFPVTVNVIDNVAPILSVPASFSVSNSPGICGAKVTYPAPIATDNCSTATLTQIVGLASGAVFPRGTTVNTFRANDASGNSVQSSFSVTVNDTEAPVVPILATIIGQCSASATTPTTTDNCAGVISGTTTDATSFSSQGNYVITWTFNDGNGNLSAAAQNVIVKDITAPVAPVLADINGVCSASVSTIPSALDNCAGIVTGTTTDALTYSAQGTHVITWSFNDGNGNASTATQNVIVKDSIAPISPVLVDVIGQCDATVSVPTAVDNCVGIVTGTTADALTYATQGTHVITWSFNDGNGNVSTATQNVIIKDSIAPIAPVLADVIGQCDATVSVPTAVDNCVGIVTGTTNDSLTYSNQGTYLVTWSFNDGNGNISTSTQNVVVKDNIAPTVLVQNQTVQLDGNGTATITATDINNGSSDNCGIASVVLSKTSFDCSNFGANTVTLTVTDIHGNVSTTDAIVTVQDNVAPIVVTQNLSVALLNGVATVTASQINNGSTDNCGIASITISKTSFDCSSIGDNTVTLTITDIHGNVSTKTAVVTIVGELTSTSIASVPTSTTYTGGVATNLYLGYGAQSTTLQATNLVVGGNGTNPKSYTYAWSGSATSQLSSTTSGSPVFTPTTAGYYTFNVLVTNKYGCTSAASISICVKDIREVSTDKKGVTSRTGKVFICHAPPGNVGNSHTLSISVNAVPSHLSQHSYDRLGTCEDAPCGATSNRTLAAHSESKNMLTVVEKPKFELSDTEFTAYPNPFGKLTTVRFTLPYQEENAVLDIYNLSGVKLQTLFNGNANSNTTYEVQFNGQNIAAGTYFFRLITAKEVKTFKVIMTN